MESIINGSEIKKLEENGPISTDAISDAVIEISDDICPLPNAVTDIVVDSEIPADSEIITDPSIPSAIPVIPTYPSIPSAIL